VVCGQSSGERFPGLMNHRPAAANSTRIATLMATMMVSQRPIALAPNAFTTVSNSTDPTASPFTSTGEGVVVKKVAA
jgi:hypothetical protein